ncbi:DUF1553 domain-containing protein [Zavarzinella formosa]|uniref:DUF1553 domain-containing protein n=1 Tax=Zavarzinella formosa TaxID=360055 RepID=UPI0002D89AC2|nr:DUF1553 domain-containing protein [Zavarzinella formosa]
MSGTRFGLLLFGFLSAVPLNAADPKGLEFFETKIRPVLAEQCFSCHSAEAQTKKKLRGGLYLDSADGLLKGGDTGPAIVPGKPKESLLFASLKHIEDPKMPPKGKLPETVIADFQKWIEMGAPDPRTGTAKKQTGLSLEQGRQFWAYRPVANVKVPELNGPTVLTDIDRFIQTQLTAKNLNPAPEADRGVLIRRLSFDLTGLPPTPKEIDDFVSDQRPDAYERLTDRLLASTAYGERWGRHWLDLARYAESFTLRGFILKEAWRYRDYVIDSFNHDLPFDQFIREQIAGDLLPADDLEIKRRRLIAATFLTMGNNNLEEQDKKQLVMDVVDEQLDTLSRAFLAQTVTCARCHDHKFDPIPTKDYYALAGILKNTKTLNHANVSMWIDRPLPMEAVRETEAKKHEAKVVQLQKQIADLKALVGKKSPAPNPKKPTVRAIKDLPGIVVDDSKAKKVGAWKESQFSGSYVGAGYIHDEDVGKGEKTLTFQFEIPANGKYEVWFAYSPGTNRCADVPVTVFSADGEKTIHVNQQKTPEIDGLFHSLGQHTFEKGGQGFVIIDTGNTKGHVIADAVLFIPADQAKLPAKPESKEDAPAIAEAGQLRQMEAELKKLQSTGPKRDMALGFEEEKKIEDVRIHIRGSGANLGAAVPRGFLQVAMWSPATPLPPNQSGRKELAEWIADARNPLTARVYVNRVWHWLLGVGLVRTTDNFGTTGETPSHPELLDHLARQFVESGWSTKKLIRMIVLSHAYRQSSKTSTEAKKADPENRLLSHMNRRRLDAEAIRDAFLSTSGDLRASSGGITFKPELTADYNFKFSDPVRSVYVPVFRNSLPEIFEVFDFADPSVSTGKRNVSTVAPQALFMTNHSFVIEQSRKAAERLLAEKDLDDGQRIDTAFRRLFGRSATNDEQTIIRKYLGEGSGRDERWPRVMQSLYASVDFRYVD